MTRKLFYGLLLFLGITLIIQPIIAAQPDEEKAKVKDLIEWVAPLRTFPKTREDQLEFILTTELQRRVLLSLQEKGYLKTGRESVYSMEPFQVTEMREGFGGISELDVLVKTRKFVNNRVGAGLERYLVTLRHDYDMGFIVKHVRRTDSP